MDTTLLNSTQNVQKLTAEENMPVAIVFSIILTAGIVGNIVVLMVFIFRFKRTTSAILIVTLAAFELLTCLFGIPFHIVNTLFPLAFIWNKLCKLFSFVLTFSIVTSLLILDLIAYDRYKKICTPHTRHLSPRQTGFVCILMIVFSCIFSFPMLFVYGTSSRDIGNMTATVCFILDKYTDTLLHDIYDGLISVVYVFPIFILIGFHVPVVRRIWKLRDLKQKMHNFHSIYRVKDQNARNTNIGSHLNTENILVSEQQLKQTIPNGYNVQDDKTLKPISDLKTGSETGSTDKSSILLEGTSNVCENLEENTSSKKKQDEPNISQKKKRITIMFIIITVVFIVTYLPYLIFKLLGGHDEAFMKSITSNQFLTYDFLTRLYFISGVIHPFIYWFLNQKYQDEVKVLLTKFKKCFCKH